MGKNWLLGLGLFLVGLGGCSDPTTIGRFRATPVTNVILENVGVVDEPSDRFAAARPPHSGDLLPIAEEYQVQPGDVLRVSINELDQVGVQRIEQVVVSETGRITLPVIGTLPVSGSTELQIIEDIVNKLTPNIIKDPQVGVQVLQATGKRYYISGVAAPGPYALTEHDFRVRDAFAQAGGIPAFNADYAYVIRMLPGVDGWDQDWSKVQSTHGPSNIAPGHSVQPMSASEQHEYPEWAGLQTLQSTAEDELLASVRPDDLPQRSNTPVATSSDSQDHASDPVELPRVVRGDSGFGLNDSVVAAPSPGPTAPMAGQVAPEQLWAFQEQSDQVPRSEVIRIRLDKLQSGDPSENIVIRPGDDIQVPPTVAGIYYLEGQIRAPGPYQMTSGQRMTIKQAISGAGALTALAWPTRCELIRRIGENQETIVPINLKMIMEGNAPDLFLKPGDIINVGSHPVAQWVAVVRSSFRSTYGFGFVYDRNFADVDFGR